MYDKPFHSTFPEVEHRKRNLSEFLSSPWNTHHEIVQEGQGQPPHVIRESFPSLAVLRTDKLRNHLAVRDQVQQFHVLRYEEVLKAPSDTIMKVLV